MEPHCTVAHGDTNLTVGDKGNLKPICGYLDQAHMVSSCIPQRDGECRIAPMCLKVPVWGGGHGCTSQRFVMPTGDADRSRPRYSQRGFIMLAVRLATAVKRKGAHKRGSGTPNNDGARRCGFAVEGNSLPEVTENEVLCNGVHTLALRSAVLAHCGISSDGLLHCTGKVPCHRHLWKMLVGRKRFVEHAGPSTG